MVMHIGSLFKQAFGADNVGQNRRVRPVYASQVGRTRSAAQHGRGARRSSSATVVGSAVLPSPLSPLPAPAPPNAPAQVVSGDYELGLDYINQTWGPPT